MTRRAPEIISDDPRHYRWVLLQPADYALHFEPHSHSDCEDADYESALNASTLALAKAAAKFYENEAADPVAPRIAQLQTCL